MQVELRSVFKHFGAIVALSDVSLTARGGEVTCLLGDNGAGKSSLIRILSGVYQPDAGEVLIDGVGTVFDSPGAALSRGIATVHQDLGLIPLMSVWRNFFLGAEPTVGRGPLRRLDIATCKAVTRDALETMGISLRDPDQAVGALSGGERQSIAIARALHRGAQTLILDEPTAALGVKQAALVLENIRRARERGAAVVLVTHNPQHALAVGDTFIVLQHGKMRAARAVGEMTAQELTVLMSGQDP